VKSHGGLYPQIVSFENLFSAARRAALGKKTRPDVARFLFDLEMNVLQLREELLSQSYRPGEYHRFHITDPKPRVISAAPFRDRVVHHALCQVIEPLFERSFISDSYACRVGKGTHRALDRFTHYARRHRYVLKCDVQQFFPSVDHVTLLGLLRRRLRDGETMGLIATILASEAGTKREYRPGDTLFSPFVLPRGLPIGNLTSQFWGNVYLDPLDHYLRDELGVAGYVRYCDDFVIFGDAKQDLAAMKGRVASFLAVLCLCLHPSKCLVYPVEQGVAFLGFKVFPDHRLLLKPNHQRFRKRMRRLRRDFARGSVEVTQVGCSLQAWLAHAAHGDTNHLRERLLSELTFSKG
jgi:hypothetical protein